MSISNEKHTNIAKAHTIKKFDLIEAYTKAWAQKLLNYKNCNQLVFIDCMSNSGLYEDVYGNIVYGTPVRVSKYLREIAPLYPNKSIKVYFSDLSQEKIDELNKNIPDNLHNLTIETRVCDGNDLLKNLSCNIKKNSGTNYLVIYDPYDASIDWEALSSYLNNWGEIIINHMVSDSVRGIAQAKREDVIKKYETTYMQNYIDLIGIGTDADMYEKIIKTNISNLRANPKQTYFVASFPFFNSRNALVYNLMHCTSNQIGFKLYKTTAWKTFGGKSSGKNTHGVENQLTLDFSGSGITTVTDDRCYNITDISKYIASEFKGQNGVKLEDIYSLLDCHPIFPSEGFKREIQSELKSSFGVIIKNKIANFK